MARRGTYQAPGRPVQIVDPAALERALTRAARVVLDTASPNVPYDTGELLESGDYRLELDQQRVVVGYSDSKAIAVHEDMESDFNVGGPKFLENALHASRGRIRQILVDELRRR